jgi:hypothetical protein
MALARARRVFLLGRPAPWYRRAAEFETGEVDAREHGAAAAQGAAMLAMAEEIDEGLRGLGRPTVERSGQPTASPAEALFAIAHEADAEEREGLGRVLARALRKPIEALAGVFARCAEIAAEQGVPELISPAELEAATRLLSVTDDSAREVLAWTSVQLGRSPRAKLQWTDQLRALRNPDVDACLRPAGNPWPALQGWRERWGMPGDDRARFEASGKSGWLGAWAVRATGRDNVGAAGWPGALLWRSGLQALGRWDSLREAGDELRLAEDPGSAELLGALYAMLLSDRLFLDRAIQTRPSSTPDDVRRLALGEVLLGRLQAASLLTLKDFERARAIEPLRDAAADHFRRALNMPVPPEVGLLLCRPWAPPLASPRAMFAAARLRETLQEAFDVDWWRNPRSVPELRRLASTTASAKLSELAPGGETVEAFARWANERLGG